ncbi:MAG: DUF4493 domain-containing protein [Alistipes sp.]|nr:DUF4493 domain-containing protein [Alistipes sp.]
MKKIFAILSVAMALVSCSTEIDPAVELTANEGAMRLGVAFQQSATVDEEVVIKIYKVEGEELNLVRRYTSLNDVPEYLALLAGDYVAKVQVGEKHIVSFDQKYYLGEKSFTVKAGEVSPVSVDCKIQSTVVRIEYDATVAEKLNAGYFTNVSVAESYNPSAIASGDVHSLRYEETKEGYFVLPADHTTLFWHFEGEHPVEGAIMKEAKIENVKPAMRYTVKLKYSKDAPGGIIIEAIVDDSIEEVDDTLIFSPDPTVIGDGFNEKDLQLSTDNLTYNIASLANINKLSISADGVEYDVLSGSVAGVNVTKIDDLSYKVTITPEFFTLVAGGNNVITINVEDVDGGKVKKDIQYSVQGIMPLASGDYNLWYGNVTFKAIVLDTTATNVKIAYSADGTTWTEVAATATSNGYYTAAGTGFSAEKNYSYKLIVNGADSGKTLSHRTADGVQLPNSDFEEWSDNYTPGGLWSSGNNNFTKDLLSKEANGRSGSCARAQSKSAMGKFAAGNLFTADFLGIDIGSMSGRVRFGKNFTFTARPKSLSFYMRNQEGSITHGSGNPASGTDVYSSIVLITDGTTYTVDTTDKSTFLTFDNLKDLKGVIAYGYVSGQDSNSNWTLKTVELTYVDNWASMTPKAVSVSFSPSAYGDYFCGSTDSWMCVDDVRFNY